MLIRTIRGPGWLRKLHSTLGNVSTESWGRGRSRRWEEKVMGIKSDFNF